MACAGVADPDRAWDTRGYTDFEALLRGEFIDLPVEPCPWLPSHGVDWDVQTGHRLRPRYDPGAAKCSLSSTTLPLAKSTLPGVADHKASVQFPVVAPAPVCSAMSTLQYTTSTRASATATSQESCFVPGVPSVFASQAKASPDHAVPRPEVGPPSPSPPRQLPLAGSPHVSRKQHRVALKETQPGEYCPNRRSGAGRSIAVPFYREVIDRDFYSKIGLAQAQSTSDILEACGKIKDLVEKATEERGVPRLTSVKEQIVRASLLKYSKEEKLQRLYMRDNLKRSVKYLFKMGKKQCLDVGRLERRLVVHARNAITLCKAASGGQDIACSAKIFSQQMRHSELAALAALGSARLSAFKICSAFAKKLHGTKRREDQKLNEDDPSAASRSDEAASWEEVPPEGAAKDGAAGAGGRSWHIRELGRLQGEFEHAIERKEELFQQRRETRVIDGQHMLDWFGSSSRTTLESVPDRARADSLHARAMRLKSDDQKALKNFAKLFEFMENGQVAMRSKLQQVQKLDRQEQDAIRTVEAELEEECKEQVDHMLSYGEVPKHMIKAVQNTLALMPTRGESEVKANSRRRERLKQLLDSLRNEVTRSFNKKAALCATGKAYESAVRMGLDPKKAHSDATDLAFDVSLEVIDIIVTAELRAQLDPKKEIGEAIVQVISARREEAEKAKADAQSVLALSVETAPVQRASTSTVVGSASGPIADRELSTIVHGGAHADSNTDLKEATGVSTGGAPSLSIAKAEGMPVSGCAHAVKTNSAEAEPDEPSTKRAKQCRGACDVLPQLRNLHEQAVDVVVQITAGMRIARTASEATATAKGYESPVVGGTSCGEDLLRELEVCMAGLTGAVQTVEAYANQKDDSSEVPDNVISQIQGKLCKFSDCGRQLSVALHVVDALEFPPICSSPVALKGQQLNETLQAQKAENLRLMAEIAMHQAAADSTRERVAALSQQLMGLSCASSEPQAESSEEELAGGSDESLDLRVPAGDNVPAKPSTAMQIGHVKSMQAVSKANQNCDRNTEKAQKKANDKLAKEENRLKAGEDNLRRAHNDFEAKLRAEEKRAQRVRDALAKLLAAAEADKTRCDGGEEPADAAAPARTLQGCADHPESCDGGGDVIADESSSLAHWKSIGAGRSKAPQGGASSPFSPQCRRSPHEGGSRCGVASGQHDRAQDSSSAEASVGDLLDIGVVKEGVDTGMGDEGGQHCSYNKIRSRVLEMCHAPDITEKSFATDRNRGLLRMLLMRRAKQVKKALVVRTKVLISMLPKDEAAGLVKAGLLGNVAPDAKAEESSYDAEEKRLRSRMATLNNLVLFWSKRLGAAHLLPSAAGGQGQEDITMEQFDKTCCTPGGGESQTNVFARILQAVASPQRGFASHENDQEAAAILQSVLARQEFQSASVSEDNPANLQSALAFQIASALHSAGLDGVPGSERGHTNFQSALAALQGFGGSEGLGGVPAGFEAAIATQVAHVLQDPTVSQSALGSQAARSFLAASIQQVVDGASKLHADIASQLARKSQGVAAFQGETDFAFQGAVAGKTSHALNARALGAAGSQGAQASQCFEGSANVSLQVAQPLQGGLHGRANFDKVAHAVQDIAALADSSGPRATAAAGLGKGPNALASQIATVFGDAPVEFQTAFIAEITDALADGGANEKLGAQGFKVLENALEIIAAGTYPVHSNTSRLSNPSISMCGHLSHRGRSDDTFDEDVMLGLGTRAAGELAHHKSFRSRYRSQQYSTAETEEFEPHGPARGGANFYAGMSKHYKQLRNTRQQPWEELMLVGHGSGLVGGALRRGAFQQQVEQRGGGSTMANLLAIHGARVGASDCQHRQDQYAKRSNTLHQDWAWKSQQMDAMSLHPGEGVFGNRTGSTNLINSLSKTAEMAGAQGPNGPATVGPSQHQLMECDMFVREMLHQARIPLVRDSRLTRLAIWLDEQERQAIRAHLWRIFVQPEGVQRTMLKAFARGKVGHLSPLRRLRGKAGHRVLSIGILLGRRLVYLLEHRHEHHTEHWIGKRSSVGATDCPPRMGNECSNRTIQLTSVIAEQERCGEPALGMAAAMIHEVMRLAAGHVRNGKVTKTGLQAFLSGTKFADFMSWLMQKRLFGKYDLDCSGTLELEELKQALTDYYEEKQQANLQHPDGARHLLRNNDCLPTGALRSSLSTVQMGSPIPTMSEQPQRAAGQLWKASHKRLSVDKDSVAATARRSRSSENPFDSNQSGVSNASQLYNSNRSGAYGSTMGADSLEAAQTGVVVAEEKRAAGEQASAELAKRRRSVAPSEPMTVDSLMEKVAQISNSVRRRLISQAANQQLAEQQRQLAEQQEQQVAHADAQKLSAKNPRLFQKRARLIGRMAGICANTDKGDNADSLAKHASRLEQEAIERARKAVVKKVVTKFLANTQGRQLGTKWQQQRKVRRRRSLPSSMFLKRDYDVSSDIDAGGQSVDHWWKRRSTQVAQWTEMHGQFWSEISKEIRQQKQQIYRQYNEKRQKLVQEDSDSAAVTIVSHAQAEVGEGSVPAHTESEDLSDVQKRMPRKAHTQVDLMMARGDHGTERKTRCEASRCGSVALGKTEDRVTWQALQAAKKFKMLHKGCHDAEPSSEVEAYKMRLLSLVRQRRNRPRSKNHDNAITRVHTRALDYIWGTEGHSDVKPAAVDASKAEPDTTKQGPEATKQEADVIKQETDPAKPLDGLMMLMQPAVEKVLISDTKVAEATAEEGMNPQNGPMEYVIPSNLDDASLSGSYNAAGTAVGARSQQRLEVKKQRSVVERTIKEVQDSRGSAQAPDATEAVPRKDASAPTLPLNVDSTRRPSKERSKGCAFKMMRQRQKQANIVARMQKATTRSEGCHTEGLSAVPLLATRAASASPNLQASSPAPDVASEILDKLAPPPACEGPVLGLPESRALCRSDTANPDDSTAPRQVSPAELGQMIDGVQALPQLSCQVVDTNVNSGSDNTTMRLWGKAAGAIFLGAISGTPSGRNRIGEAAEKLPLRGWHSSGQACESSLQEHVAGDAVLAHANSDPVANVRPPPLARSAVKSQSWRPPDLACGWKLRTLSDLRSSSADPIEPSSDKMAVEAPFERPLDTQSGSARNEDIGPLDPVPLGELPIKDVQSYFRHNLMLFNRDKFHQLPKRSPRGPALPELTHARLPSLPLNPCESVLDCVPWQLQFMPTRAPRPLPELEAVAAAPPGKSASQPPKRHLAEHCAHLGSPAQLTPRAHKGRLAGLCAHLEKSGLPLWSPSAHPVERKGLEPWAPAWQPERREGPACPSLPATLHESCGIASDSKLLECRPAFGAGKGLVAPLTQTMGSRGEALTSYLESFGDCELNKMLASRPPTGLVNPTPSGGHSGEVSAKLMDSGPLDKNLLHEEAARISTFRKQIAQRLDEVIGRSDGVLEESNGVSVLKSVRRQLIE